MVRTFPLVASVAGIALALVLVPPARADWPSTPGIGVPVCVAPGYQGPPVLLPDGSGGTFVAWIDYRFTYVDRRCFVQYLDALGNPAWDVDGLSLGEFPVSDDRPWMIRDPAGNQAFVVWREFRADTAGNLFAQRLAPTDAALWGAGGVPVSLGPLHERYFSAASDGQGGLLVVWSDDRDGSDWQIRAQRLSPYGTMLWDEAGVVVAPNGALQNFPYVAPDGEGGAVVAWTDYRGLQPNVYAQRLSPGGVAQWSPTGVVLSTSTHGVYLTALAPDKRGGAFAALFDYRSLNSWPQAFGQHVDRNGACVWPADGLSLSGPSWPVRQVDVCPDDAGGAFLAWRDYENAGDNYLFAAHADSSATSALTATIGYGYDGNGGAGSALEPDDDGGALVVWNGFDVDAHSVWAQRFDASLTLAWPVGGVKVAHSTGLNFGPRVATDDRGGAIVSWRDDALPANGDVYAARVDATGQLGTAGVPHPAPPSKLSLSAGPSPARAGGAITFRLAMPQAGEARLTVFDVAGRSLAVLRGRTSAQGRLALRWDGRDEAGRALPSGLYFARAEAAGHTAFARVVVTD